MYDLAFEAGSNDCHQRSGVIGRRMSRGGWNENGGEMRYKGSVSFSLCLCYLSSSQSFDCTPFSTHSSEKFGTISSLSFNNIKSNIRQPPHITLYTLSF